ncbi:MAG: hypothetical protein J6A59_03910 [Lachnospiraceae bacterium]|nr:hypothetical protein [Lachnospiraceae bacterium]
MRKLTEKQFPLSRYRHCYSVGKKMYHYAKNVLLWDEKTCQEMFVLGSIHDIGYEIDSDAFGHDEVLANIMSDSYKYSNEIRYHSYLQTHYDSPAMRLLYFGDMTVDGTGNWCTFEERLKDLENRYGKNSAVYIESLNIANYLISLGFDDTVS